MPQVRYFANLAAPLFTYGPLSISSFGRTRSHNAAVGGAANSQHLVWTAADLVPLDGDMQGLEYAARQMGFGFVLNEGDHVHVQLYAAGQIPADVFRAVSAP